MLIGLIAVVMFVGAFSGGPDAEVQVQTYIDAVNPIFEEAVAAKRAVDAELG